MTKRNCSVFLAAAALSFILTTGVLAVVSLVLPGWGPVAAISAVTASVIAAFGLIAVFFEEL